MPARGAQSPYRPPWRTRLRRVAAACLDSCDSMSWVDSFEVLLGSPATPGPIADTGRSGTVSACLYAGRRGSDAGKDLPRDSGLGLDEPDRHVNRLRLLRSMGGRGPTSGFSRRFTCRATLAVPTAAASAPMRAAPDQQAALPKSKAREQQINKYTS